MTCKAVKPIFTLTYFAEYGTLTTPVFVCLLDWGGDNLFLKLGGRCHWHLKMNRSVEVSLSFLAYDTQTDDNYSQDDSHCEKKKKCENLVWWLRKSKWIANQMRNEALLHQLYYHSYFTLLHSLALKKTCYTNLLISINYWSKR